MTVEEKDFLLIAQLFRYHCEITEMAKKATVGGEVRPEGHAGPILMNQVKVKGEGEDHQMVKLAK